MNKAIEKQISDKIRNTRSQLSKLKESKRDEALRRFDKEDGCDSCRGRGWVVTWDTLDSMSGGYAEYGGCPSEKCTEETRSRSGHHPVSNTYDRNRGTVWRPVYSQDETKVMISLNEDIGRLESDLNSEIQKWTPRQGVIVKVVNSARGRKDRRTPVGVTGLIKRKFTNQWGTEKLLMIDDDGKKWWPSCSQVEVIDPAPDLSKWVKLDKVERTNEGYPVIATIQKRTGKAALVKTITGAKMWIPISQVPEIADAKLGVPMSIMIPMWLALSNNLVVQT